MKRAPDLTKRLAAYLKDKARLQAQFDQIEKLREAGKLSQARELLKKVEASPLYRRVKAFQETHYRE